MFAVIRAGGKQFKVEKGDVIEVERLAGGQEKVEFSPLLVVDDKGKAEVDRARLDGATVTGKVVGDSKGRKIFIQRYRSKTGYHRKIGHRQSYTKVEIDDIKLPGKAKSTARKKEKAEASDGT